MRNSASTKPFLSTMVDVKVIRTWHVLLLCRGKHSPQIAVTARWKKLPQDEEEATSGEEKETVDGKETGTVQDEAR